MQRQRGGEEIIWLLARQTQVQISVLPFQSMCITLGKGLEIPGPQLHHLWNWNNKNCGENKRIQTFVGAQWSSFLSDDPFVLPELKHL